MLSWITSATATLRWARFAFASFAAAALMPGGEALAQETEPVTAVFKAHEVDFLYRSSSQLYACHELENRVANILRAVGARDDIKVDATDCEQFLTRGDPSFDRDDPFDRMDRTDPWARSSPSRRYDNFPSDRDQSARVRIWLMMPVEMTPEVREEMAKDKTRRDLVSRVTGNPAAAFNDPIVFAARRQEVKLPVQGQRFEAGDCVLLEQMIPSVFRELNVRVVRRNFSCNPRQPSRVIPQLTVETLVPTGALLPMPEPEKKP